MNCNFPDNAKNILKLDEQWIQTLPNGQKVNSQGAGTGGWAINPNFQFQCQDGGYCPYACETGYIETQYDNGSSSPYVWQMIQNGQLTYIGGGNKKVNVNGQFISSGGKQGVKCDNGQLKLNDQLPQYSGQYCIETPRILKVKNNSEYTVTFCRTTMTFGIPQIPTVILPGQEIFLTTIPSCKDEKWVKSNDIKNCNNKYMKKNNNPVWWNGNSNICNQREKVQLTYFISRANENDLSPTCQFNKTRPSTMTDSVRGVDYYPYLLTVDGDLNVRINSNNDTVLGSCAAYDTSLGNPKFGMRLYDRDNIMVGQVEYMGNSTSAYSYIINKGKVRYDCASFRKGLMSKALNGFKPVTIEIYDVKDSDNVRFPISYCKGAICEEVQKNFRLINHSENSRVVTRQTEVTATTTTTSSSSNKTTITIIVIVIVIIVIIAIAVAIYLLSKYFKERQVAKQFYAQQELRDVGIVPFGRTYGISRDPEAIPAVFDIYSGLKKFENYE